METVSDMKMPICRVSVSDTVIVSEKYVCMDLAIDSVTVDTSDIAVWMNLEMDSEKEAVSFIVRVQLPS